MSIIGRLKGQQGGHSKIPTATVASAGTIPIGTNDSLILISSAAAVDTATTVVFLCADIRPGRPITLINANASDAITLKNTVVASALNGYLAGKADIVLGAGDTVNLIQLDNGSWLANGVQDNS